MATFTVWWRPSIGVRSSRVPPGPIRWNDCPNTYRSSTSVSHVPATGAKRAPTSSQRSRTRASTAGSRWGASTQVAPAFTMPALSRAISSVVSPRIAVWSSATGVMTAASGAVNTFVASNEPPNPTSTTCQSTRSNCARTSQTKSAVSTPKVLTAPFVERCSASTAGMIASTPVANSSGEMAVPSSAIRSV